MPPRRKPVQPRKDIRPVSEMLMKDFLAHCREGHSKTMRFLSRGEHEADHRLHQEVLNHSHSNQNQPATKAGDDSGGT